MLYKNIRKGAKILSFPPLPYKFYWSNYCKNVWVYIILKIVHQRKQPITPPRFSLEYVFTVLRGKQLLESIKLLIMPNTPAKMRKCTPLPPSDLVTMYLPVLGNYRKAFQYPMWAFCLSPQTLNARISLYYLDSMLCGVQDLYVILENETFLSHRNNG